MVYIIEGVLRGNGFSRRIEASSLSEAKNIVASRAWRSVTVYVTDGYAGVLDVVFSFQSA